MSSDGSAEGATLIVFGRVPVLGQVKTRLAAEAGAETALAAYRELLERALATGAAASSFQARMLMLAGDDREGECARLALKWGFGLGAQRGRNLGERMAMALDAACSNHRRAVLIGSDCPALAPDDLNQAAAMLDGSDAVIAPAEDGGYALIGCARPGLDLFDEIDWGSERVFEQTMARAQAASVSVALLRTLWDVDTASDWRRWQALTQWGVSR